MTRRWRVWLMLCAGVVALGAGMMLGHAVLLAVGLGLAGLSGIGTPGRGRDTGLVPPELGVSTDTPTLSIPRDWRQTLFGRARRGEHPFMDDPPLAEPGAGTLSHVVTRRGHRVVVLDTGRSRRLLVYGPDARLRVPVWAVELDADEADRVATLLRSRVSRCVAAGAERPVVAMGKELR